MRWFYCNSCGKGYDVFGPPGEVERLLADGQSGFPCITSLCQGRLVGTVPHSHNIRFKEVPLPVFYRAVKGMGFSQGAPAGLERAIRVLIAKRVVEVVGESTGTPERTIIRCLVLEDGTRLHFDTSTKGACLYYIEEPGNELPSAAAPESHGEGGEEAGRGTQALPEISKG